MNLLTLPLLMIPSNFDITVAFGAPLEERASSNNFRLKKTKD